MAKSSQNVALNQNTTPINSLHNKNNPTSTLDNINDDDIQYSDELSNMEESRSYFNPDIDAYTNNELNINTE